MNRLQFSTRQVLVAVALAAVLLAAARVAYRRLTGDRHFHAAWAEAKEQGLGKSAVIIFTDGSRIESATFRYGSEAFIPELLLALSKSHYVSTVEFEDVAVDQSMFANVREISSVRRLSFFRTSGISKSASEEIARVFPYVQSLAFVRSDIDEDSLDAYSDLTHLRAADFSESHVDGSQALAFAATTGISKVSVSRCDFTGGLRVSPRPFSGRVKEVDVSWTSLSKSDVERLVRWINPDVVVSGSGEVVRV